MREYRFDRDHNSYFRQARALRNRATASDTYNRDEIKKIRERAECRATSSVTVPRKGGECLRLTARLAGNGLNVLVIEPDALDRGR